MMARAMTARAMTARARAMMARAMAALGLQWDIVGNGTALLNALFDI